MHPWHRRPWAIAALALLGCGLGTAALAGADDALLAAAAARQVERADALRAQAVQREQSGDWGGSVQQLHAALAAASRADDPNSRLDTLVALSQAHQRHQDPALATFWAKLAAQEQLRPATVFTTLPPKRTEPADVQPLALLTALLAEQDRAAEAAQALQLAKALELQDELAWAAEAPTPQALPWSDAESTAARTLQRTLAEERSGFVDRVEARRPGAEFEDDCREASAIDDALQSLRARPAAQAGPATPPAGGLAERVAQLAAAHPGRPVLGLQIALVQGRLLEVLHTSGGPPQVRWQPVDEAELHRLSITLRLLLSRPQSDAARLKQAAQALYQRLLQPIEPQLQAGETGGVLLLSLHGALRNLPFAVLHDGRQYLVERWATVLDLDGSSREPAVPAAAWRVAAMAASQPVAQLGALPGARDEVSAIVTQPNVRGQVWLDQQFSAAQLRQVLAGPGDYQVLHIASHFVLVPGALDTSRLYLGDQSTLSVADIARENLRFDHFELVALSACSSAVDAEGGGSGQWVESLAAGIGRRGAQAVLATLWRVGDPSTAAFMRSFYRVRGLSAAGKAQTLRSVQLAFLRGQAPQPGWQHPFHWAGFVLLGNAL